VKHTKSRLRSAAPLPWRLEITISGWQAQTLERNYRTSVKLHAILAPYIGGRFRQDHVAIVQKVFGKHDRSKLYMPEGLPIIISALGKSRTLRWFQLL